MNLAKLFFSSCLLLARQLNYTALAKSPAYNKTIATALENSCFSLKSQGNMNDEKFKYEIGSSSIAFVTAPDEKFAKKLAKELVEQKLAACVNIIPYIQSVYIWEGKLNDDQECLMIIKTRSSRLEELTNWVRQNHPYSVAEVITVPIETGNMPYMKWLSDSVPEKN